MNSAAAYPVQILREHLTGLEAAISVCLADPGHKPVHKLRTGTRRIEALLLLLALVPGMPEHHDEAAALLRKLARLRRAAGKVRDLDVHRKLLKTLAEAEDLAAKHGSNSSPDTDPKATRLARNNGTDKAQPTPPESSGTEPASNAKILSESAGELRKRMARKREKAAAALLSVLKERQASIARTAEGLLKLLEPAGHLALPAPELLRDAHSVLARDGLLTSERLPGLNEDELHSLRKAAKAARYLAESLENDPSLERAAQSFEALQEAGGQWHDALELARAAKRHFGKAHELTAAYREERDRKLEAYRAALTAMATEINAPRKHAKKALSRRKAAS